MDELAGYKASTPQELQEMIQSIDQKNLEGLFDFYSHESSLRIDPDGRQEKLEMIKNEIARRHSIILEQRKKAMEEIEQEELEGFRRIKRMILAHPDRRWRAGCEVPYQILGEGMGPYMKEKDEEL